MRGSDERTGSLFSFVDLEELVPARHPLRKIRQIVNDALATLDGEFSKLYASEGRPSIAPEKLLSASLLQAFYSIRSERQLIEQLGYNLLFRWFVGLGVQNPIWLPTMFTNNCDRLLDADVAARFMASVLAHWRESAFVERPLLRRRHARRGVGQSEELLRKGRVGRASVSRSKRRAWFSRREARQRHPREHDRPRREALLHRPRAG